MQTELFNEIEKMKGVPNELLKDITDTDINIDNLTAHTTPQPQFSTNAGNAAQPTQPGAMPLNQPGLPQAQQMNVGNLITGEMAVNFLNVIAPVVLVLVFNKMTDKKVIKKQFELSNDEKKIMQPALQNYLNSLNFTVDTPLNALVITVGIIYGSKVIEIAGDMPAGTMNATDSDISAVITKQQVQQQSGKQRRPRPTGLKYNKSK